MGQYLIYRHGSNAANQSMTPVMTVCSIEAKSRAEAVQMALESGVTCYNNQRLEARPASRCSREDCQAVFELESAEAYESGTVDG